jgi:hypothetical protein
MKQKIELWGVSHSSFHAEALRQLPGDRLNASMHATGLAEIGHADLVSSRPGVHRKIVAQVSMASLQVE